VAPLNEDFSQQPQQTARLRATVKCAAISIKLHLAEVQSSELRGLGGYLSAVTATVLCKSMNRNDVDQDHLRWCFCGMFPFSAQSQSRS
jgi:hypothetical protein